MVKFYYQARTSPQRLVEGLIEADDPDQAVVKILGKGQSPVRLLPASEHQRKTFFSFQRSLAAAELLSLTQQLCDLLETGLPILHSLQIVVQQSRNPRLKSILEDIVLSIRDGSSLSDALAHYPEIFSGFYVNMVRCGELSGQLNVVLRRLAELLEQNQKLREAVTASLIYPAIIFAAGIITIFILFVFVIPHITILFEDFHAELPWLTKILIAMSGLARRGWWLFPLASGFMIYGWRVIHCQSLLKKTLHRYILEIPVLGNIILNIEMARFARTLATLLESGVMIVPALNDTERILSNEVLKQEVRAAAEQVMQGNSVRAALGESRWFPLSVVEVIAMAEESGRLEPTLHKLAESLERTSAQTAKTFTSLLEPLMITFMGMMVGFIVLAILLPVFGMSTLIGE